MNPIIFYLSLSLLCISFFVNAQNKQPKVEKEKIKLNKITSAEIFETVYRADTVLQKKYKAGYHEYDTEGNVVMSQEFDVYGKPDGFISYFEYQNGKLIREKIKWILDDGEDVTLYQYDENGNLIKETEIEDNEIIGWKVIVYNQNKAIQANYFNADGSIDNSLSEIYDDMGRVVAVVRGNAGGETFRETNEYNKQGLLAKEVTYSVTAGKATKYVITHEYNKKNQVVRTAKRNENGKLIFETKFIYEKDLLKKVESIDYETNIRSVEDYIYYSK
jgi:hypothetical protein